MNHELTMHGFKDRRIFEKKDGYVSSSSSAIKNDKLKISKRTSKKNQREIYARDVQIDWQTTQRKISRKTRKERERERRPSLTSVPVHRNTSSSFDYPTPS